MSPKKMVVNQHHDKAVAKGAWINFFGTIGKVLMPVFFVVVSRLYGATFLGLFVLVNVLMEVILQLTVSGLNDGILMYASRYIDDKKNHPKLYQILANGFVFGGVISVLLILLSYSGLFQILPVYNKSVLQSLIKIMILGLPFYVFPIVVIAGTKAFIEMKWDALLNGFIKPFSLVFFAVLFHSFNYGLLGLAWGYVLTGLIMTIISAVILWKYYSIRKLFNSILHFKVQWELVRFAIPQNLNLTFSTFITNLDIMMLGYFHIHPAMIGYYGIGAKIVRNLQQVKLVFSGAYSPVIARLYSVGNKKEMNISFNRVIRWIMSLAFPLAILLLIFHRDILQIFNSNFGVSMKLFAESKFIFQYIPNFGSTSFMMILIGVPLLSCSFGLAGNVIIMTGHSGWNLVNSLSIAVLNLLLNWFFIPKWGFSGAAMATFLSSFLISLAQLIEVRKLYDLKYAFFENGKIFLSFIIVLLPFLFLGEELYSFSLVGKFILLSILTVVYVALLILFKVKDFTLKQKVVNYFSKK